MPAATALTAGELRHRLLRAILAIDPHAAARRYHRAVTRRQVVGYLAADGTAVITASGLPADEAAAACARVDHVADHLHRRGYPGTITQVRAEVFLRLLDGRLTGLTTDQIITTSHRHDNRRRHNRSRHNRRRRTQLDSHPRPG